MPEFPRTKPWWVSIEAWRKIQETSFRPNKESFLFEEYFRQGGSLGTGEFIRKGFPDPPTAITPRARDILERTGGVPRGVTVGEPPTPRQLGARERIERKPPPPAETPTERIIRETAEAAEKQAGRPFPGQEGGRNIITQADGSTGFWGRDPVTGQTQWNQLTGPTTARPSPAPTPEQKKPAPNGVETFVNSQGQTMTWDGQEYVQTGFDPSKVFQPEPSGISPFQQGTLDFQQQQLQFQQEQARQEAEFQRQQEMARLSANPINWLQFAAFTGEQPVVQPWMIPLGFQQFGENGGAIAPQGSFTQAGQQLEIGQPIPGLQGSEFSGLPQLRRPSAQLQARWGPTAEAQFLGFERARTGASVQETQFRLASGRAPSGRFGGFSRFR